MERIVCETLKLAQKIGLPNSDKCEFNGICDGGCCPKFNLDASLNPCGEDPSLETITKVPSGTERFFKKLEGWSQKRAEKEPAA